MKIASSAKMSEKHQNELRETYPGLHFSFFSSMEEVMSKAGDLEVLLTYGDDLSDERLSRMPRLKWIQVLSAGLDKMPLEALEKRNILVTNARGIHGIPMSEYTLGVMLYHVRRFGIVYEHQKERVWDRSIRVDELEGKRLGIIGAGAIGTEIARKARLFGMEVIGLSRSGTPLPEYDRVVNREGLPQLLAESDFVVLVAPLTPETYKMMGEKEFRGMKREAVFINIARGALVDEKALVKAMEEKWIAACYLDVFTEEPLPPDHPFWGLPNCWITPHMSGLSPRYMERALRIFTYNLTRYLNGEYGEMKNRIHFTKGY
ncbi:D-isomer specific 2-hydroxyacid dehydrogenase NAD-binding protein [[Clostridium] ultunense Esp]|nr:D-isomer specific 2-hydroxyacid dehydrogenase NAD-binding protein [[Clostridium] ultunense Esp]